MKNILSIGVALAAMGVGAAQAGELSIGIANEGFVFESRSVGDVTVTTTGLDIQGASNFGDTNFKVLADTYISMQGDGSADGFDGKSDSDLRTFKVGFGYDFGFVS